MSVSLEIRREQISVATELLQQRVNQSHAEFKNIFREMCDLKKSDSHLNYELSPFQTRCRFFAAIPHRIVLLIVQVVETIFLAGLSFFYCFANFTVNSNVKSGWKRIGEMPIEIIYLFYAAIDPKKGIDRYYDFKKECI